MQLIGLSCNEQFIYKYIDLRSNNKHVSEVFYSSYVYVSLIIGVIFYLLILIFNESVYYIFISGLNNHTYNLFQKYFNILSISIIFIIPINIIQAYLNANYKIGFAYLAQSVPNIFIFFGLTSFLLLEKNVIYLAKLFLIGNIIVFFWLFFIKNKTHKIILNDHILETIKSSIKVRTAHNIHNFLSLVIVNNFVSGLPLLESSTFLYVKRISDTIFSVVYNPTHRLLVNLISAYKYDKELYKLKPVLIKNTVIMCIVFLIIGLAGIILVPGLNYIYPIDSFAIKWISINFICLMFVNLLMAVEIPYAIVSLTFNSSRIFFISNSIYIISLYLFMIYGNSIFEFYTLGVGLAVVQIINFILIRRFAILAYIK
jgi:O-antigen/teichoic acid export membrane protein